MPASLSQTILIGNLGKDPKVGEVGNNNTLRATFSVATEVNKKKGDEYEKETDWHNVVAWGENAEFIRDKAGVGTKVVVIGRSKTRKYESQGETKYITEITADVIGICPKAKPRDGQDRPANRTSKTSNRSVEITDDDIPF